MTRLLRYSAVLCVFAWVAAAVILLLPASSAPAAAADGEAQSQSKTLTRDYFDGSGDAVTKTNHVTVNIDRHTDIQSNERVHISWTGAHPTGGRSITPYGAGGINQEYPMLVMECRGNANTVTPETCWTSAYTERTTSTSADPAVDSAVWLDDKYATDADKQRISGLTDDETKNLPSDDCKFDSGLAAHITPFKAASGKTYYACSDQDMPPEAAENGVTPPNEIAAFTSGNGTGATDFEIRTNVQNESLGCSSTVQCSIVVVPIEGISCAQAAQSQCNLTGEYQAGQYDQGTGSDQAVTAHYWWSASNWRNRFVFPIQIAPPPSVCQLSSAGTPVPFFGSELLSQAALQWTPAYCLNKSRFNWQDNVMPDDAAFTLMQNNQAAAALVSDDRSASGVAYAPTAVTGWGIAFDIDKPDGSPLSTLNLNARLLAKLLTESYPGSSTGAGRPGIQDNPWSLNLDPEFQKLNPGLDARHFSEAAATLLALSIPDDVMQSVTSYIASDPDAMSFIDGTPDPWGMKVNPAYKNMSGGSLPSANWPLLDTWAPKNTGSQCLNNNQAPYMAKIASPLSSLRLISTAMLYNWPNVSTVCGFDAATNTYTLGRTGTQGIGSRFMLGLVTLADAHRYGLTVAKLQAAPGSFVAPTNAGLSAAVGSVKYAEAPATKPSKPAKSKNSKKSKKSKKSEKGSAKASKPAVPPLLPAKVDQATIRKSSSAYPGTMLVYTAAKTTGLPQTTAAKVAQFIRVSSTEGQVPGRGNGQLPDGYLPITKTGVTARLYSQAQDAAAVIAAQKAPKGPSVSTPGASSAPSASASPSAGASGGGSVAAPPGAAPASAPSPAAVGTSSALPAGTVTTSSAPLVKTSSVTSSLGGGLLPFLLLVGLFSGLVTLGGRVWLHLKGAR